MLGYYAHLITDAEYLRFCRDPEQLHRIFERIYKNPEMWARVEDKEENFMSLKNAFGKEMIFSDITAMENKYLQNYLFTVLIFVTQMFREWFGNQ